MVEKIIKPIRLAPISPWQQRMISTCCDPDCSGAFHDRMLLRWAQLIYPHADERRIGRAFTKLVARHESLRLQFREVKGEWKAAVQPVHAKGLIVENFGDVSDETFNDILEERSRQKIEVLSDTLFEIHLLKFGKRGDVLLSRAHHAIMDGYSAVLVIEELVKLLLNMPMLNTPITHGQYISHLKAMLRKSATEKNAFWENAILPLAPAPNIDRKKKGRAFVPGHLVQNTICLDNVLVQHEIDIIEKRASRNGLSLYAYLYAAFADVLCEEAKVDDILICTVLGRNDYKMNGFVGPDIQLLTLKFTKSQDRTLDEAAAEVVKTIHAGVAQTPTTAFMPGTNINAAYSKTGRQRMQFFVHCPDAQGRKKNSVFSNSLETGSSDTVSIGRFRIERLNLAVQSHTDAELQLTLQESTVVFGADAKSFTEAELLHLKNRLRKKLDIR